MSFGNHRVLKWLDGATYAIRQVYTQTGGGGGNVIIEITPAPGSEFMVLVSHVGPDDYGAGRSIRQRVLDEDGNVVYNLMAESIDNVNFIAPRTRGANSDNDLYNPNDWPIMVSGNDVYDIRGISLANTETLTISIRLRVKDELPTISKENSTGTVGTPTTTINRIL